MVMCAVSTSARSQEFSVTYGDMDFVVDGEDQVVGSFKVFNLSDEVNYLRVYSGDWVRDSEDKSDYVYTRESGNEERSLLRWMTFTPDLLVLEPGESDDVICRVDLPDDVELDGSYWAVVFVEEAPSLDEDPIIQGSGDFQVGITTKFRYAVKLFVTFSGTEFRDGTLTDLELEETEESFLLSTRFENTGNIYMKPDVWLEIRDLSGSVVYRQDHIRQTMLPESSRNYSFEVNRQGLNPGTYLIMVIADYGGTELVAVQASLEIQ
jgi:hypothetical protein